MKISNPKTMSRLIEIALNTSTRGKKKDYSRYTRNLLNLLYRMDKNAFLPKFPEKLQNIKKKVALKSFIKSVFFAIRIACGI